MISVIIATYGEDSWRKLARERAFQSTLDQATDEVVVEHLPNGTLAQARNAGAERARSEWLIFLDGDDELAPNYCSAMRSALSSRKQHSLFTPMVSQIVNGRNKTPMFHREIAPEVGNWLVIGTMVPRDLFFRVGGFEEWPIYEDWALFARMQKAGATTMKVPRAVYIAHRRAQSRNHALDERGKRFWHEQIRQAVFPESQ